MPCLHDEPYASPRGAASRCSSDVARLWFLSEPEHQLAHRVATLPAHDVTGAGVNVPDELRPRRLSRPARARRARSCCSRGAARRGKGWDWLLAAFHFAIRQYALPFDLVTIGVSPADTPPDASGRVHDLGFLDDAEVADAFAAAAAYVQPSTNESFSRTIDGVVARRHAGARERRAATSCTGTANARAAA